MSARTAAKKKTPKPLDAEPDEHAWMTPRERAVAKAEDRAEAALGAVKKSRTSTRAQRAAAVASYWAEMLRLALPPVIVRDYGGPDLCTTQFEIWNSLVHQQPQPFARLLRPLTRSRHKVVASHALHYLAWIGLDTDLPAVLKAARSGDARLVNAALGGGALAARHAHASTRVKRALAAAATAVATGAQKLGMGEAADEARDAAVECLTVLDPRAARALLRNARCIHPDNTAIREVLWKLYNERTEGSKSPAPDADDLWGVYDAIAARSLRTADDGQTRGLILTMTADTDPARTRTEAQRTPKPKRGEWDQVAEFAKEALRRCKGVVEPETALRTLQRRPNAFGHSATAVLRAYELGLNVMGDGLTISLANGSQWREAKRGLDLLGLDKGASLLAKAAKLFGPKGPPVDARSASDVYESLSEATLARLEPIDEAFFKQAEKVFAATSKYIGAHPRDFSPAKR